MTMNGRLGRVVAHALLRAASPLLGTLLFAQPPQINPDNVKLTMAPVQGKVYVLMGDGGNITVQVGKDGVMLVDTGFAPLAPKAMAEIRKLSDGPIRWIVNTHVHTDHTGGNAEMAKLGMTRESVTGAPRVVAQSNVLNRMTARAHGQSAEDPRSRLAQRRVLLAQQGFLLQRRGGGGLSRARGAHRRRQHRVLPPIRRAEHRRCLYARKLSRSSTWRAAEACKVKSTR